MFDAARTITWIEHCRLDGEGRYAICPGGAESLYASCFAIMTLHYLGESQRISSTARQRWAEYMQSHQSADSGWFVGPETVREQIVDTERFSLDHVLMHLTVHAIPALAILGARPRYRFTEAEEFLETDHLRTWLESRNWGDAWLEGNNILFVLQLLAYMRDRDGDAERAGGAARALRLAFEWLDSHLDPRTGLWGTDAGSDAFVAMCGAYHELLAYFHEGRAVPHHRRLVDTVLSLQHRDGGFFPGGGGGACEDVDAIDILVNCYKLYPYRRQTIRAALQLAVPHLLKMQAPDAGFLYRKNEAFDIMSLRGTSAPANVSNLFATWFRVHTLALISEILDQPVLENWHFNPVLSMGWHRKWQRPGRSATGRMLDHVARRVRALELSARETRRRASRAARSRFPRATGLVRRIKRLGRVGEKQE